MKNIAVLASGRGSNLEAIIENIEKGTLHAHLACVISDNKDARALQIARDHDFKAIWLDPGPKKTWLLTEFEEKYVKTLQEHNVELVCLGSIINMEIGVRSPEMQGNLGPFMIARNDDHWNAMLCNSHQWLHGHLHQSRGNTTAVKQITRVYHDIHIATDGGFQSPLVVHKKIWASSAPLDPGTKGHIEAQVRISKQKDAHFL